MDVTAGMSPSGPDPCQPYSRPKFQNQLWCFKWKKKKISQLGLEKPQIARLSICIMTSQRLEWPPFIDHTVSTTLKQTWMTWKQMVITWFGAGRYFLNFDNHRSSAKKQSGIDETRAQILKTMMGLQMFCLSHLYTASLAEWVFSFECLEMDSWSAKILFVWR